ncbi:LysM peptidoglycan-binding domain-containing protein [candidate division FCPU426 bacterium]|nr:LysM peptidoglycan-binding domain-containing protein [candidate division FCPU426 bacterium]
MQWNEMMKISAVAVVVCGMMVMAGCGGKKEVKPEPTPVAVAPEPTPEPEQETQRYSVMRGDTLWDISGNSDIYGDNFQWPLIFKANRDQIEDPDIIEIGQDLAISREFTQEEVEMAIENAKRTPRYVPHTKPRRRLPIEY